MKRFFIISLLIAGFVSHPAIAKGYIVTPADFPVLGELDPFLIEKIYTDGGADYSLADICDDAEFKALVAKHNLKLFGGPMLGSVTDTRVRIWVRTPAPANIQIKAGTKTDLSNAAISASGSTFKTDDLTAILTLSGLSADTRYYYDVLVDGESIYSSDYPSFKTFPVKGQLSSFAVGFGGGIRYNHEYERIFNVVEKHKPIAFLQMGDNVYHDKPQSRSGQRVHYYRRQLRPEYRNLVGRVPQFAIWDDHDFCGNDCGGGASATEPAWKVPTWNVFKENWANPGYGGGGDVRGVWYNFSIGPAEFFMLDSRYYRVKGNTMLGPVQKAWLKEQLSASTAVFKVIVSPAPWAFGAKPGSNDPWNGFKDEREEIFSHIESNKIGGVFLLSADRHRHDVWKIARSTGYDFWEFESSRMTNDHSHGCIDDPERIKCVKGRAFGLLNFDFSSSNPQVTYEVWSIDDELKLTHTISRNELGDAVAAAPRFKANSVSASAGLSRQGQMQVYNCSGKRLAQYKSNRRMPDGVYIVRFISENGTTIQRPDMRSGSIVR